jgi:predicted AlkP superfamily phosphohydrolase/phosphomutase
MKVFILGLDGATFDLLDPMIDEGILPNIKDICSNYSSGQLMSIFPPVTGPAWLALASGLNPGKTGVFDYINRKTVGGTEAIPISSSNYENRAVWEYLGKSGYKVGIFNYPTLSPAPKVNGFSVSGIGAYSKANLCYPPGLEEELKKITGEYEINLNLKSKKYMKNIFMFFEDLKRVIGKQEKALKYLVKEKEWDFFFAVFHFTDWMEHILWKYLDDTHPLYDPEISPAVKSKFKEIWRKIDDIIGELLNFMPDTIFMIVSDHGQGPLDSAFYPNTWLVQKGWLTKYPAGLRHYLAEKLQPLSAGVDNKYGSALLRRFKTKILKNPGTMDLIDLDASLAYSPIHAGMYGCINLTAKGLKKNGFKEQLIDALKALPNTLTGIDTVDVYLPQDLYSGPYVELSPDIQFVINGYRASVEIDFAKEAFISSPSINARTGSHRSNGIFMARGDIINKCKLSDISVLDIAPTVFALYNMEIPFQVDGKVMAECIHPDYLNTMNIKQAKANVIDDKQVEDKGDIDEMKKTLESLGYM